MKQEMDAYLRGVLPLLDEEKIALLLAKGPHVVDKVFDISQSDKRLKGIIESIYAAGTNRCLINKLDGNKALMDAGFTNFSDFYFNCEAKNEELVKLADQDVIAKNNPTPYWKRVIENLCWDIPAEHVFTLFAGFVYSVSKDTSLPNNTERLEGAYNYLRFQLEKAGVTVLDMPEQHKKIEEKLPNVLDVKMDGVGNGKTENLEEMLAALKKKHEEGLGLSVSRMYITGIKNCSITGSYYYPQAISGTLKTFTT